MSIRNNKPLQIQEPDLKQDQRAVANNVRQQKSNTLQETQTFDNRPEAKRQRQLRQLASSSLKARQALQLQRVANGTVVQLEKAHGQYLVNTNATLREATWPYKPQGVVERGQTVDVIDRGTRRENFSLGGIFGTKRHHSWVRTGTGATGWIEDSNLSDHSARLQRDLQTYHRFKGGRTGAKLGISRSAAFNDYRRDLACYNFAVGSFNNNKDERELQASIPQYVFARYGHGQDGVISQQNAIASLTGVTISGARATAVDNLMQHAGMVIGVGAYNPDWFSSQGAALRVRLKMPLQEYILSESGFEVNPNGNWAVGFRGSMTELGSDHAWLKLIDPRNPNRYITFDTFPHNPRVQVNRKRHADPYTPRPAEHDFQVRVTGPTAPQWAIIDNIPDAPAVAAETDNDDRRNLHPRNY